MMQQTKNARRLGAIIAGLVLASLVLTTLLAY